MGKDNSVAIRLGRALNAQIDDPNFLGNAWAKGS